MASGLSIGRSRDIFLYRSPLAGKIEYMPVQNHLISRFELLAFFHGS